MSAAIRLVAMVGLLLAPACASAPTSPSRLVRAGTWGGDHVTMTVTDTATQLVFDCAHGDIAGVPPTDANGQFSAAGTYVMEHGGPIAIGAAPDSHPASYSGNVSGNSMALTVRLTDLNETIGSFALTYGSAGRVVKCL